MGDAIGQGCIKLLHRCISSNEEPSYRLDKLVSPTKISSQSMPGDHDKTHLTIGLFNTLLGADVVRPQSVSVDKILSEWIAESEQEEMSNIINGCVDDPDAPIEYMPGSEERLWLTDREEAEEYVEELKENPLWYDN